MASRLINRIQGKVFGWFDSKSPRDLVTAAPTMFSPKANLALLSLEDRITPATLVVNTDVYAVNATDNLLSVAEAVAAVNSQSNAALTATEKAQVTGTFGTADAINFDAVFFSSAKTITTNATITPTKAVAITGLQSAGTNLITFTAPPATRVMSFNTAAAGTVFSVDKFDFRNNAVGTGFGGGVIRTDAQNLTVSNCVFDNNQANSGAAIALRGAGTLTINSSTFTNNTSLAAPTGNNIVGGGALYQSNGTLNVNNCTISGNTGNHQGGGFWQSAGTATFNNSVFLNNQALKSTTSPFAGEGGAIAIFTAAATLNLNNCVITGNTAVREGGGIYTGQATPNLSITNSTISNNTSQQTYGGGVHLDSGGTVTISGTTISGNSAVFGGGLAAFFGVTTLSVNNSTISGNLAAGNGGGAYLINQTAATTTTFRNTTITGNTSTNGGTSPGGGGICFNNTAGTLTLISTIVSGNDHTGTNDNNDIFGAGTTTATFSAIGSPNGHTLSGASGNNLPNAAFLDLGTLADNGGANQGLTTAPSKGFTFALGAGSAARNTGSNPLALTTDQRGTGFPRELPAGKADIGSFEATPPPTPTISATFANITTLSVTPTNAALGVDAPGGNATTHTFTVNYTAPTGQKINDGKNGTSQSLGNTDLTVTGPNAYTANATFVSSTSTDNNASVTATYTIPANAFNTAVWDFLDSGAYAVTINASEVSASGGGFVPTAAVGTITAAIGKQYIVDEASDINDGDLTTGKLSLREAVADAKTTTVGALDFITFSGTTFTAATVITEASALPIDSDVFITNTTGVTITLTPVAGSRGIAIDNAAASGLQVKITSLAVAGASAVALDGAGIFVGQNENVTLNSVRVTGNSTDATASGGGIGVFTGGNLTLIGSTVSGNGSTFGGGIYFYNGGTLDVVGSTISGNGAGNDGGGVYFFGTSAKLRFLNSTLSSNFSGGSGGGLAYRGSNGTTNPQFINSTVTLNAANYGGGIARILGTGPLTLTSSIVSGNIGQNPNPTSPDVFIQGNSSAGAVAATFSAIGVTPGAAAFSTNTSNLFGAVLNIQPLANNGGATLTHALGAGSAARNAGSNSTGLATDQRGQTRSVGTTDIGSYEAPTVPPLATPGSNGKFVNITTAGGSTYAFTVRYTADAGTKIDTATLGPDDITVIGNTGNYLAGVNATFVSFTDASAGAGTVIDAKYTVTANTGGTSATTFDAGDNDLYDIVLNAGKVADLVPVNAPGGLIGSFFVAIPQTYVVDTTSDAVDANDGVLSLREAVAAANDATLSPAQDIITFFKGTPTGNQVDFTTAQTITFATPIAINDSVTITGTGSSLLSFNGAGASRIFTTDDGALFLNISGTTIENASSATNGGAITLNTQVATFTDVVFNNNTAPAGAAIANSAGAFGPTIILDNSKLTNNTGTGTGVVTGAIYFSAGAEISSLTLRNGSIASGNVSPNGAGAVVGVLGTANILIQNSKIINNSQTQGFTGGAILLNSTAATANVITVENSLIDSNLTGGTGAFIGSRGGAIVTFRNSTVSNQNSTFDGGVYFSNSTSPSTLTFENSTFANNKGANGAVAAITAGTVNITNSTLFGNTSSGSGSVLRLSGTSTANIRNSTITANSASAATVAAGDGGALSSGVAGTTINLVSTIVAGNQGSGANGRFDIASAGTVNATNSAIELGTGFTLTTNTNNLAFGAVTAADFPTGLVNNGGTTLTVELSATSAAKDKGSNPLALTTDQRGAGFVRSNGVTDIGAFEIQSAIPAFDTFTINNGQDPLAGATRHSRIYSIELNFLGAVNPGMFPNAGDILLSRTTLSNLVQAGQTVGGAGGTVQNDPVAAANHITVTQNGAQGLKLTFDNSGSFVTSNTGVENGSLSDGYWRLFIGGTAVSPLNGLGLRRLYGDSTNVAGGTVDTVDLTAFGNDFNSALPDFDFDNNGSIGIVDLTGFGNRFNNVL